MKTVLITGTTSGIGAAFSKLFASKGYRVVLIARDADKVLEQKKSLQTTNNEIHTIVYDLQKPDAADEVYQEVVKNGWNIDVLINNAGFNEAGYFLDTDESQEEAMIDLHIKFVTKIMKLLLSGMKKRKNGRIVNVGSTGSYIACPKDAVYAATKAYVLHLSKALHLELKGTGVTVTTLCPGSTRTEFARKADMEELMLFKLFVMSPNQVAEAGYKGMLKGKSVVIPGFYNKLLVLSSIVLPYSMVGWMTKKML